jgi:shikimate kinase
MNTIILAGPKHSGKTSTGRALAALAAGVFVDLDEYIEEQTGKSPRTLYREGPGVFRAAEAGALETLLRSGEGGAGGLRVIAAGGGLIDNAEALALPELAGPELRRVYIEVSAETAWTRIRRAAETGGLPPFLDTADPQAAHRLLHERRSAAYRTWAPLTVKGEGKSPEEIAKDIAELCGPLPSRGGSSLAAGGSGGAGDD